jgi:hypothetical protein
MVLELLAWRIGLLKTLHTDDQMWLHST